MSIKIEMLKGFSYLAWKQKVLLLHAFVGLYQYIESTFRGTDVESEAKWVRGDRKAQAIIVLSLSNEHLEKGHGVESAKEVWDEIKHVFERDTL